MPALASVLVGLTRTKKGATCMDSRCIILDIGGVLEITPVTGWEQRWEQRLGLPLGHRA